jgi:alcohol dehydrogenase class IV
MITDALAKEAFSTVYGLLPASYAGDTSVRQKIHTAATMAGMAFNGAGLGLCHAMSHALGGAFHLPHGRLNAILLPAVISCNAHAAGEKYQKIAAAAGVGGSAQTMAVRNLKNALVRLRRELDMPDTLAQAGVSPTAVRSNSAALVQAVLADPCCDTNPIPVEDFMVRRVLDEVTGRA